jgi:ComF family protein
VNLFQELLNALVPSKCELCHRRGWSICGACRQTLKVLPRNSIRQFDNHTSDLAGISFFDYLPPIPNLMHAFKERGITEIIDHLVDSIDSDRLVSAIEQMRGISFETDLVLVPVPSSLAAFRQRGFSPASKVARSLSKAANSGGLQNRVINLLMRSRSVADQASLDTVGRRKNQQESMVAIHQLTGDVLLIDDIVTTGATLSEARRAVNQAGGRVIGFCTLAETLLKQQVKSAKPNT